MDVDFQEHWHGWRLRGRFLVSDNGQRITQERLRGLLWRDELELRRAGYANRRKAEADARAKQYGPKIKVVIVELSDLRIRDRSAG